MVKTIENLVTGQKIKAKSVPFYLRFAATIIFMGVVFMFAAVITYFAKELDAAPVNNYEDCVASKGSIVEKTYPAVCSTKSGDRFLQPLSPEEQKLLKIPETENGESEFCGGIMGKACPEGFACKYEGSYPDAGGKCVKD